MFPGKTRVFARLQAGNAIYGALHLGVVTETMPACAVVGSVAALLRRKPTDMYR